MSFAALWALPWHTKAFIGVIILLTIWYHFTSNRKAIEIGPTILTTIGIFATFVGIALGLNEFDSSRLATSLPHLLEGLKTAVWASVFGIGGALTLKFRQYRSALGSDAESSDFSRGSSGGGSDILELSSQISQLAGLLSLKLDQLTNAQAAALQTLATSTSGVLVKALDGIVTNFNHSITNQFGQNFKNFADNIEKLAALYAKQASEETSNAKYRDDMNEFIRKVDLGTLQKSLQELNTSMNRMDSNFEHLYEMLPTAPRQSRRRATATSAWGRLWSRG